MRTSTRPTVVVVTCEHGGNRIPPAYATLFRDHEYVLSTHRGYDPGALDMARSLARAFDAVLISSTVSRLLVDLNRSIGHPALHSKVMRAAPESIRGEVQRRYYVPYRRKVESAVRAAVDRGARVVHISSHSFAPRLAGVVRRADAGLLYDPRRSAERELCACWRDALRIRTKWRVRRNYPYAGTSDGLTQYLRTRFASSAYSGIELEINQNRVRAGARAWASDRAMVVSALGDALGCWRIHPNSKGAQ